jgi:hypothetical protein
MKYMRLYILDNNALMFYACCILNDKAGSFEGPGLNFKMEDFQL